MNPSDSFILPSPIQELHAPLFQSHSLQVFIKRDDLIHPIISGNKWRKLKYNILSAQEHKAHTLISYGGAYSNHIHALAYAGKIYGFNTVGIIRGDECLPPNKTLADCQSHGMHLHYVARSSYKDKENHPDIQHIISQYPHALIIPEGGSNIAAVKGCMEIWNEEPQPYDYIILACGTGTTLAGISIACRHHDTAIIGISALKGDDKLSPYIHTLIEQAGYPIKENFSIHFDYHFGGYAKYDRELLQFMKDFESQHHIPLEQVYTGKMAYAFYKLLKNKHFKPHSKILLLHTGGLQGKLA